MIAIFYDRKNKREVSSEELMETNVISTLALTEDNCEAKLKDKTITGCWEFPVGTLCYKTKKCPKMQNWDKYLKIEDLVFLRLEHSKKKDPKCRFTKKK